MVAAAKQAVEIKVLSNKGLVFFGTDESVISLAEWREFSRLRRLRILLMSPDSAWINRGMIKLRQYESPETFKELRATHSIIESAMSRFSALTQLRRIGIRYFISEPCFRMFMTEEVAFLSSYAEHPSVQVRDLPVYVFRMRSGSLYGAAKRRFPARRDDQADVRPRRGV